MKSKKGLSGTVHAALLHMLFNFNGKCLELTFIGYT